MDTFAFDAEDYPDGCVCGVCGREFQHGDPVVNRPCGDISGIPCTTPVCPGCTEGSLADDHPANRAHITMRADGTIDTSI
jgi:hypothetical protein